jgi:hypothetical protein
MTDMNSDIHAGTITAMRRADEISVANGRKSCAKQAAECICQFKDELNGNGTVREEEGGPWRGRGMNVGESVPVAVAMKDEGVEVEGRIEECSVTRGG